MFNINRNVIHDNKDDYKLEGKGSDLYRENIDTVRHGGIPERLFRILPFIPGDSVLEIGSAEGVLALLLAEKKKRVIALELVKGRHKEALYLQQLWREKGFKVENCQMLHGDIRSNYDLLTNIDTFVAIRVLYHLEDDVEKVMCEVASCVEYIVLSGNKGRSLKYFKERGGSYTDRLGSNNYYATLEGMWVLLEKIGFKVTHAVPDGDPIVVGKKKSSSP